MARAKRQLTGSSVGITVEGVAGVHQMLAKFIDVDAFEKRQRLAAREAAKLLAKPLRAEVGKSSSRMRRAVYIHNMRGSKTGVIVGHHKSKSKGPKGDFWPMVIGGTRDHGPRKAGALVFEGRNGMVVTHWVKGVTGTNAVQRVSDSYGERAQDVMIEALMKG